MASRIKYIFYKSNTHRCTKATQTALLLNSIIYCSIKHSYISGMTKFVVTFFLLKDEIKNLAVKSSCAVINIELQNGHEKGTTLIFSYIRAQVSKHTVSQNNPTRMTQSPVRPISGSFHWKRKDPSRASDLRWPIAIYRDRRTSLPVFDDRFHQRSTQSLRNRCSICAYYYYFLSHNIIE